MTTSTLAPSVQIGEILVPGATSLHGARTFMLTRPSGGPHGVEIAFGLFAGETQKRVIDRLADRLFEELRPVSFAEGMDAEARFEASLKRANSVILGFLHEHGLSLPGIKLRGAFGLLAGDRLFLANRGSFRGVVVVPQTHVPQLTAFTLFEEGSDTLTHPKFFGSFQDGVLPAGARLFIASSELFQATDEAFAIGRFTDPDSSRSIRDLKNALKASRVPVSVLTLAIPRPGTEEAPSVLKPQVSTPQSQQIFTTPERPKTPVMASPKPAMADVGDLVSRGLRAIPNALAAAGRTVGQGLASAYNVCARAGSAAIGLFRGEDGRFGFAAMRALPERAMEASAAGINRVPRHRVAHFVALFLVVNLAAHAAIFTVRRQALVGDVKAYEGKLATVQQLQTDLESSLIYGDVAHAQELSSQLESLLGALPQETAAQKNGVASAQGVLNAARLRIHRTVAIAAPTVFATLDAATNPKTLTWWNGGLYAFSSDTSGAQAVGADGTVAPSVVLKGLTSGIAQALPGSTGVILLGTDGSLAFWNPAGDTAKPYEGAAFDVKTPLLYYQNRIYGQDTQGGLVRRNLLAQTLGSPVASVPAAAIGAPVTGLAADGALYVMTAEGAIRKFVRGNPDDTFHRAQVEPAPTQASNLVGNASRLAYLDQASDRVVVIDARDGSLVAQATSPAFKDLRAVTFDADGKRLLVLQGDGKVFALPLAQLKP